MPCHKYFIIYLTWSLKHIRGTGIFDEGCGEVEYAIIMMF